MKELDKDILYLFLVKKYSSYDIHIKTGAPIKHIYHIIERSEQAKRKHKEAVYNKRQEDKVA